MSDEAHRLAVDESGPTAAPSILFLHGGNLSGVMWGPQREALDDFHQLVPDLPGFGDSRDIAWSSIGDAAEDVAEVIRERGHDDVHIVGLSLGAAVGAVLTARHPDLVASALLSGTPLRGLGPAMRFAARAQLRAWRLVAAWATTTRGGETSRQALAPVIDAGIGIRPGSARPMVREVSAGIAGHLPQLDGCPVPILGVAGARESAVVVDALAEFRRAQSVELALAPGMHHIWNYEDPQLFNDMIRTWVTERRVHPTLEPWQP